MAMLGSHLSLPAKPGHVLRSTLRNGRPPACPIRLSTPLQVPPPAADVPSGSSSTAAQQLVQQLWAAPVTMSAPVLEQVPLPLAAQLAAAAQPPSPASGASSGRVERAQAQMAQRPQAEVVESANAPGSTVCISVANMVCDGCSGTPGVVAA